MVAEAAAERLSPQAAADTAAVVVVPPLPSRRLVLVLTIACAVSVANLYYNQPLLAQMARSFGVTEADAGAIPTLTQVGYAIGLCLIVPLGDMVERRRLILVLLALVSMALAGAALAPTLPFLAIASTAIGITTVVPQVLLPFAAQIAPAAQRGRTLGTIMGGLLFGILLSRTVGGFIGAALGWRAMFWTAAGLMIALMGIVRLLFPVSRPPHQMTYSGLLRSVVQLAREQPLLRESALLGALLFGAFSAFWATLAYQLASPAFRLGAGEAGLFGLVGAVGAAAAPVVGRLADSRSLRFLVGAGAAITLASYAVFFLGGQHLWGLVIGVILLDLGVQAAQVANQTRVYSLVPTASSRLNTFYMTSYFIGGSLGSLLGTVGWAHGGWPGVCIAGALLSAAAIGVNAISSLRGAGQS